MVPTNIVTAGMNDDGSINSAMLSGAYEVSDGILMFTQDDIDYTAEIIDGVLYISGINVFFEKRQGRRRQQFLTFTHFAFQLCDNV